MPKTVMMPKTVLRAQARPEGPPQLEGPNATCGLIAEDAGSQPFGLTVIHNPWFKGHFFSLIEAFFQSRMMPNN